ncbi:MAG TPA: primosomal protein N' [Methylomirabilota bacterium]|nr:primosomal protein N' [Methylomirabilota bacterium]
MATSQGGVAATSDERLHYRAMGMLTCEVVLPVPVRSAFTYRVPEAFAERAVAGARVLVPFRKRTMVGVIVERGVTRARSGEACVGRTELQSAQSSQREKETKNQTSKIEAEARLRDILDVLDDQPAIPPLLARLGRWVANYYLAPEGEVFHAILPPAVDLRRERELRLTDAGRERKREIDARGNRSDSEIAELALLQFCEIEAKPLRADRAAKLPGGAEAALRLLRRGMLEAQEVALRRKARTQKIVGWVESRSEPQSTQGSQREKETKSQRSRGVAEERLRHLLCEERGPMPVAQLLREAKVSRALVDRLLRQGRLQIWEEPLPAEDHTLESDWTAPANTLNADQQHAVDEIAAWMNTGAFTVGLLYGVTGSGKTEVYLAAIEAALARGRTALLLVPEIALTLWLSRQCRARFGTGVAVLHSGLADVERVREWWRVRAGEARVVVGTRSAVFAPLENLGVVIVDEEQETSYKQEETPRYHGRDVAIVRAKMEGAVALLGSATPSLESFYHAQQGRYKLLQLESRVEGRPLAPVEVVDLREEFRRTHKAGPISEKLREAIAARLDSGTQALVLVNRRGYSWYALCRSCGVSVQCENCSIALTYHKQRGRLVCHYCGYSRAAPKTCPKCGSEHLYYVGAGAEQIEEHLREIFPHARIGRLDRDTARKRRAYHQLLGAFAAGRLDILVGTQMVAKGHDFHRVTLAGVVSADAQLGMPDFRAAERTFQILTQVAGRAGRGELPGKVLVETYYPEHYAITLAAQQDYVSFFERELQFRRMLHYPPFAALASVLVRDARLENAVRWSREIERFFRSAAAESRGVRVLGPSAAPLARLRREYRFQFLLKAPQRKEMGRLLRECLDACAKKEIPERAVLVDVDPLSMM